MEDLKIVDAHHHLWDLDAHYHPFLTDAIVAEFNRADQERLFADNAIRFCRFEC